MSWNVVGPSPSCNLLLLLLLRGFRFSDVQKKPAHHAPEIIVSQELQKHVCNQFRILDFIAFSSAAQLFNFDIMEAEAKLGNGILQYFTQKLSSKIPPSLSLTSSSNNGRCIVYIFLLAVSHFFRFYFREKKDGSIKIFDFSSISSEGNDYGNKKK